MGIAWQWFQQVYEKDAERLNWQAACKLFPFWYRLFKRKVIKEKASTLDVGTAYTLLYGKEE